MCILSVDPGARNLSIYLFQVLYPDIKINDWRKLRPGQGMKASNMFLTPSIT